MLSESSNSTSSYHFVASTNAAPFRWNDLVRPPPALSSAVRLETWASREANSANWPSEGDSEGKWKMRAGRDELYELRRRRSETRTRSKVSCGGGQTCF